MKSNVQFLEKLPTRAQLAESLGFEPEKFLVVYDKRLRKNSVADKWLKNFKYSYPVSGGEELKQLSYFPDHIRKIFKLVSPFSARSLCMVSVGGGSVGDFVGFTSSVIKRGLPLIHIPSTLLAAMDSAHGGKTALNVGSLKNQIGTFYPASSILIVKNLFADLPRLQLQSAAGELTKTVLLEGGELFKRFESEFKLDFPSIWSFLPDVIEVKNKIVTKDPFEKSGERQILNLGHSLGHALESYYGIPHGVAVGEGLLFAISWSAHQGFLPTMEARGLLQLLNERTEVLTPLDFAKKNRAMSRRKLEKFIYEDKKLTDTRHLAFIFLEKIGSPFRKVVTLESFLTETQRQGWTAV